MPHAIASAAPPHRATRHAAVLPGAEAVTLHTGRAFPRHAHDDFGFGLMDAGAHRSWSGLGAVEATAGDLITVNPGEMHDGLPLGGPRAWRMVYVAPALAAEAAGGAEFAAPVLRDAPLAALFSCAFARLVTPAPDRLAAEEGVALCLASLFGRHGSRRPRRPPPPPPVALARQRLDEAPHLPATLAELADLAGVSRFQLLRGFARHLGVTPHAYLLQARVRAARRHIAAGSALAEAALLAGFSDQSHMTRAFARHPGALQGRAALIAPGRGAIRSKTIPLAGGILLPPRETAMQDYVHGYGGAEATRLRDQARTLEDLLHGGTSYPAGSAVLEAGCGVGAQTVALARRSPGARLTAVEIDGASLAEAEARAAGAGIGDVAFLRADVAALPFAPATFDHAFVCFLLEHLRDPLAALREIRRVLKPGGTLTVLEGDHGSALFHPPSVAARASIACQVALQRAAGGDALTGRRLTPLLRAAGFVEVATSPRTVHADAARPDLAEDFVLKTFVPMVAGVRSAAVSAGLAPPERLDRGLADLARTAGPDGTFTYTFFKATAHAP